MTNPAIIANRIILAQDQMPPNYPKLKDNDIIIGDTQGSYEPVPRLLKSMNYNPDKQHVHFLGDLIDRGHESKQMLDAMNKYGWTSNQGNHDNKALRWAQGNKVQVNPELENTISQFESPEEARKYFLPMGKWPLYVPFEDSQGPGGVVHAAVHPSLPWEKQPKQYLLMGRTHPFESYVPGQAPMQPPWQNSYINHLGYIIHGHEQSPSHDWHGNPHVASIDQGSVGTDLLPWGGKLTGLRLGDRKTFSVPGDPLATENYRKIWTSGGKDINHVGALRFK